MRWDHELETAVVEILLSEDVRTFLQNLCVVARLPMALCDGRGQLLVLLSFNGSGTGGGEELWQEAGTRDCSSAAATVFSRDEQSEAVQEVRFQDHRVAEIRGNLMGHPDLRMARQSLQLAAEWIRKRIQSVYDLNSLSNEVLNKYEELNLLYELSEEMAAVFNTQEICDIVLRKALNVIGAEKASILLLDPGLKALRVVASAGIPEKAVREVLIATDKGICGYVFRTGKPLLVEDLADLPEAFCPGEGEYRSDSFLSVPLLLSPLKVKERVIGIINLADKPSEGAYHAGDLKLLSAISSQAALAIYNSMLIRDLKENERIQKEMEIAGEVQRNLLPRHAPRIPGVELVGRCVSAKRVGGDYYDFFPAPEGGVGVVVADVSGHSIGSGIMMSITRGLLQSEALRSQSPGELLKNVNRLLFEDLSSSDLFITMAYFTFDPCTRRLCLASGGHNPAALLRQKGESPLLLDADGMAIGLLADVDFEERHWELSTGDLLVVYTDGLVEAADPGGVPFGTDRFLAYVQKVRDRPAAEILDGLYKAVWEHIGVRDPQNAQQDDITLVILKVAAEAKPASPAGEP